MFSSLHYLLPTTPGSIFEIVYRRLVPRLGHNQTIDAVAHRLCRLIWLILRKGVRYEERGPAVSQRSRQKGISKMIRELRALGYRVEFLNAVDVVSAVLRPPSSGTQSDTAPTKTPAEKEEAS